MTQDEKSERELDGVPGALAAEQQPALDRLFALPALPSISTAYRWACLEAAELQKLHQGRPQLAAESR